MRSYEKETAWRKIQSYLPEYNRIDETCRPREECVKVNGFDLHVDHYRQAHPKGIAVVFHGVGGNGRLVEYLAIPIWKAGYEVYCPDLPMYGLSEYTGTVSYNDWVRCTVVLCNALQKQDLPFFTLGLSAGGMLAYQAGCEVRRIDGIMATCLLDQREPEVTKCTASSPFMGTIGKKMLKYLHVPFGGLQLPMKAVCNMKAIVNNEELAELLMKDPLSSGASVSMAFLYTMLYPGLAVEPENFSRCPVLLVHPGDDRWTKPELSRIFFDRIPGKKKMELLPGGGHFTIEKPMLEQQEKCILRFMEEQCAVR